MEDRRTVAGDSVATTESNSWEEALAAVGPPEPCPVCGDAACCSSHQSPGVTVTVTAAGIEWTPWWPGSAS